MKLHNKITFFFVIFLTLASCTKNFEEFNRDPYALTDDLKKADLLYLKAYFPQMQQSIYYNNSKGNWEFQIAQNLNADLFCGYLTPPTPYNNDKNNINYFMMEGWNGFAYGLYNNNIMKPWYNIKKETVDKNEWKEIYAIALILKVAGMHRMTDLYGPIPYSKYGVGGVKSEYDSQESVYKQFFKELDEAMGYLDDHGNSSREQDIKDRLKNIKSSDLIFNGDYKKWLKWANSLRLRLAIRVSKVVPNLAKQEAEKAVKSNYGFLERNSDNVLVPTNNIGHPLIVIANEYTDSRMSADMESILVGLKDPRLPEYFSKSTDNSPNIKGEYRGIRQGINMVNKDLRKGYSTLGASYDKDNRYQTPIVLMTAAEVYFLKAEGALRGWNMGNTAEYFYEKGINTSFEQWGVAGNSMGYLTNDTNKPSDYIDYKAHIYDSKAVSKVTVKWDESATDEEKLEKIITQKWIAMFPEGGEAWAEFRRTSYPKLFPIVQNNSTDIDSNIMIRRLKFPKSEYDNNAAEVAKATQLLKGGVDSNATQLWWDTNHGSSNF